MDISRREIEYAASRYGFRQEILEKAWQLLILLDAINKEETLKGKYALKGGTALNFFYFDVPRLSVDIDLNYIGSASTEAMQSERELLEIALKRIYTSLDIILFESKTAHAGGKYTLSYPGAFNQGRGVVEVDLNYMFRTPLYPAQQIESKTIADKKIGPIQVVSFEEAAAGKLSALLDRNAARDLFDTYHILFETEYDSVRLKTAFLAYRSMKSPGKEMFSIDGIQANPTDIKNKLKPVLHQSPEFSSDEKCVSWAKMAAGRVRERLKDFLNLNAAERTFVADWQEGKN